MSTDPIQNMEEKKKILSQTSSEYKEAIQEQIGDIKEVTFSWAKHLMIIGGTLFISYNIIKRVTGSKKVLTPLPQTPIPQIPKKESLVKKWIKEQITLFLLSLAKKKLLKIIENLDTKDERKYSQDIDKQEER